jgi:hypothetical protein
MRWREERQCNNQPNKRRKSGRTRGNGAARGEGGGPKWSAALAQSSRQWSRQMGHSGVRRIDATTKRTRGTRVEEQEGTVQREALAGDAVV